MYKLVIFDLDDTLAISKSPIDEEMAGLLVKLLDQTQVAIISGGFFPQFEKQVISRLACTPAQFERLVILPTQGATMYQFKNGVWESAYSNSLSPEDKKKIYNAFEIAFAETKFVQPEKIYGVLIEDREMQITFSAIGSSAPVEEKRTWDPDKSKRLKIVEVLKRELPDFAIGIGGMTSIDVTHKGIDKAYGLHNCLEVLKMDIKDVLFVGDALFPGGNDFPVVATGVTVREVKSPADTKVLIHSLIENVL